MYTTANKSSLSIKFNNDSSSIVGGLRDELVALFKKSGSLKANSSLSLKQRVDICLSMSIECIQPAELENLLSRDDYLPISYDGFEPSGRMHIAQGFGRVFKVHKMSSVGIKTVFWIADYFAMLNDKMGGDLEKIRLVGEYFIHIWEAAGMQLDNVHFLWASDEINKNPDLYWRIVMDISRTFNITRYVELKKQSHSSRFKRCMQALGRIEGDDKPASTLLYAAMQCADIFYIGADICQLGLDQRKINMLARYNHSIKNKCKSF